MTKRDNDAQRDREQDRQAKEEGRQVPAETEVQKNPDLDPNEPGIDEVERNRRREELERRQG